MLNILFNLEWCSMSIFFITCLANCFLICFALNIWSQLQGQWSCWTSLLSMGSPLGWCILIGIPLFVRVDQQIYLLRYYYWNPDFVWCDLSFQSFSCSFIFLVIDIYTGHLSIVRHLLSSCCRLKYKSYCVMYIIGSIAWHQINMLTSG